MQQRRAAKTTFALLLNSSCKLSMPCNNNSIAAFYTKHRCTVFQNPSISRQNQFYSTIAPEAATPAEASTEEATQEPSASAIAGISIPAHKSKAPRGRPRKAPITSVEQLLDKKFKEFVRVIYCEEALYDRITSVKTVKLKNEKAIDLVRTQFDYVLTLPPIFQQQLLQQQQQQFQQAQVESTTASTTTTAAEEAGSSEASSSTPDSTPEATVPQVAHFTIVRLKGSNNRSTNEDDDFALNENEDGSSNSSSNYRDSIYYEPSRAAWLCFKTLEDSEIVTKFFKIPRNLQIDAESFTM